jgi:hypothetical protein
MAVNFMLVVGVVLVTLCECRNLAGRGCSEGIIDRRTNSFLLRVLITTGYYSYQTQKTPVQLGRILPE